METLYDLGSLLAPMLISFAISFVLGLLLLQVFVRVFATRQRIPARGVSDRNAPVTHRRRRLSAH